MTLLKNSQFTSDVFWFTPDVFQFTSDMFWSIFMCFGCPWHVLVHLWHASVCPWWVLDSKMLSMNFKFAPCSWPGPWPWPGAWQKICWWGGVGGLFDYSVTPGPLFWEFDTELLEISQKYGEKSLLLGWVACLIIVSIQVLSFKN